MERINRIIRHELYRSTLQKLAFYEKDRRFCRHDIEHCLSVARIMHIHNLEEGFCFDPELLYASALLHDLGRAAQYETGQEHCVGSAQLAQEILPDCGFTKAESASVTYAIAQHHNREETEPLSRLLQLADRLSRNCFCCPAYEDCYWPETQKNQGVTR